MDRFSRGCSWIAAYSVVGAMLSGCGTTVPKAEMSKEIVSPFKIDADDQPVVAISSGANVVMTDEERTHLQGLVVEKLNARRMRNTVDGDAKQCRVSVTVTRFEKGNKFARAMLAGLGQIHIDADVVVEPAGGGDKLNAFKLSKTFAWGGMYGASTGIEDIEPVFADGIAAALTGQPADGDTKQKAQR